jgi:hypothetical protein
MVVIATHATCYALHRSQAENERLRKALAERDAALVRLKALPTFYLYEDMDGSRILRSRDKIGGRYYLVEDVNELLGCGPDESENA